MSAGKEGAAQGLVAGAAGGGAAFLLLAAAALGLLWRRRRGAAPGRASLASVGMELAHLWEDPPDEGKASQGGGKRDSDFFGALWDAGDGGGRGGRRATEMFVNPLATTVGGESDPAGAGGVDGDAVGGRDGDSSGSQRLHL